jgi:transcriptional regulator with XRE-family HTH domain
MATRDRRIDYGNRQARRRLAMIGDELREARLAAGLTQRQVGAAGGISHSAVSRIELSTSPRVSFATLALIGAVVGLDISIKAYPAGDPIRDAAQLTLLARFRRSLAPELIWRTEVPLAISGDLRGWDAVVEGEGWQLPVDAETRLRDIQALSRRLALKRRDDGSNSMVLLVADTRHNRLALKLAAPDLAAAFPVSGRAILRSLADGLRPAGSGVVLL